MSMKQVQFTKMTGAGNDFILVDNRDDRYGLKWDKFTQVVCDRRYGIGADGVLVIENSSAADFKMLYFNADGSWGGMCGNGGRCVAAFFMKEKEAESVRFEALGHVYKARRSGADVILRMKNPNSIQLNAELSVSDSTLRYHYVDTGAPHVVMYFNDLPAELQAIVTQGGMEKVGQTIRCHPQFAPDGTNVNIVREGINGAIEMRTYERGVEAETLACGTGAVACSIVSSLILGAVSPVRVTTRSGELLIVSFVRDNGTISDVDLQGPVKFVYTGEILHEQEGGSLG